MERRKPFYLMTYIALLGATLALFAFIYFLRRFSTAWSMRNWQRTQGSVVTAEMRRGKKKSPDGCLLYDPVLRYSYTVGEHTFEGSRFTHQAVSNAANQTTQFIARLTQGSEVPVYYHPLNPAEAVVQPLSWQGSAMAALTSALLLVMLAAALWFA
ncbi:MAG: hypothetical protein B7Z37_04100 [Verrucomicrobia bacterium 12-59-8]|nr:MAG: hypothetical protein B7Z37_04100 [Verrucomicrobia bacterium 12-59-8]